MRKLIYCVLLLFTFYRPGFTQVYDRSLGFGFITEPEVIRYAGNDHWMVVGRGGVEPGQLYTDTIFVLLLDRQGYTLLATRLQVTGSEIHYVYDAVPLSDGGFAISVASTLCDVANDMNTLYVLNADGSERWKLESSWASAQDLPTRLSVTPDGNLFGVAGCHFQKYDLAAGALLWESAAWDNTGSCYLADFLLEPGTENVLITQGEKAKYLVKSPAPGTPVYNVTQTFNLNFYSSNITPAPNGWYYMSSVYDDTLVARLQLNGALEFFSFPASNWKSLAAGTDGLYWLGRQGTDTRLLKTDWVLQTIQDQVIADPYLYGLQLRAHGDTVALAGIDGSAYDYDLNDPVNAYYPYYKGRSLWFRSFWGAATPGPDQLDITALELEQSGSLQIDTVGSPGNPAYKLSGGHFRLRVKNSGNKPVKQLYVNTIFNPLFSICSETPARRKFFSNLNLQPGAEQWLEFGEIEEVYQYELPEEICFWTSSPNDQPDRNHTDDYACLHLLVSTHDPVQNALQFFPNPASDGTLITAPDGTSPAGVYRVYDAIGRMVATGEIPKGDERFFLSTEQLPAGLYWLKIGNRAGKLAVSR